MRNLVFNFQIPVTFYNFSQKEIKKKQPEFLPKIIVFSGQQPVTDRSDHWQRWTDNDKFCIADSTEPFTMLKQFYSAAQIRQFI